jgi:hypothetical protein
VSELPLARLGTHLSECSWNSRFRGCVAPAAAKEIVMKTLIAIGLATAIAATTAAVPAQAREGCGKGFHRTPNGMCRPNRGTQARWIEGHYYRGQGYWWHNRWYKQRQRRNGVWIYL